MRIWLRDEETVDRLECAHREAYEAGVVRNHWDIMDRLLWHNHQAYVVGGAVRDFLLGRLVKDHDIVTDATPEEVLSLFDGAKPVSALFHSVVYVPTRVGNVEVATMRTEGGYSDGRRPDAVVFTDRLESDVQRRDFTVNGMAMDRNGRVLDFVEGQPDLNRKLIRCVGDPEQRFTEHPVRLLRAVRFASIPGFRMEKNTWSALRKLVPLMGKVPMETVQVELRKGLDGEDPTRYVHLLMASGLASYILPELAFMRTCKQNVHHGENTVLEHTLQVVERCEPGLLRVCALLHDTGKPMTKEFKSEEYGNQFLGHEMAGSGIARIFCEALRFTERETWLVEQVVHCHMMPIQSMRAARRLLARLGGDEQAAYMVLALRTADRKEDGGSLALLEEVLREKQAVTIRELAVNGNDLMRACGIGPGPRVGSILRSLLDFVVDSPDANVPETLLAYAKSIVDVVE